MSPRTVLLDAYDTLFDVHSVALRSEPLLGGHADRLSLRWRDQQIDDTRLHG